MKDSPPSYVGEFEVAPVIMGAPPPSSFDSRGDSPGLAVKPYEYAQKDALVRSMRSFYNNIYKGERMLFGGCGKADDEWLWSPKLKCNEDPALTKKAWDVMRETVAAYVVKDIYKSDAPVRKNHGKLSQKLGDSFYSAYAFISTLSCASTFLRANRRGSHGIDILEQLIWFHALAEYTPDVDLDTVVLRDYWNIREPIVGTCPSV